jgi:hypothetical protein
VVTTNIATSIVTVTTTTSTTFVQAPAKKRNNDKRAVPPPVPAYASACTMNGDSYTSACSCLGAPGSTTVVTSTAAATSTTTTVTSTTVTTTTSGAVATQTQQGVCGQPLMDPGFTEGGVDGGQFNEYVVVRGFETYVTLDFDHTTAHTGSASV